MVINVYKIGDINKLIKKRYAPGTLRMLRAGAQGAETKAGRCDLSAKSIPPYSMLDSTVKIETLSTIPIKITFIIIKTNTWQINFLLNVLRFITNH